MKTVLYSNQNKDPPSIRIVLIFHIDKSYNVNLRILYCTKIVGIKNSLILREVFMSIKLEFKLCIFYTIKSKLKPIIQSV